ncbi:hypothetical protein MBANPS3_010882 [Mucor bainieri]
MCLYLTDFWRLSRKEVRYYDHERFFWVERVAPFFFKFLAVSTKLPFLWCEDYATSHTLSQIILSIWTNTPSKYYSNGIERADNIEKLFMELSSSAFNKENVQHTVGDNYKLILLMKSALGLCIRSHLDCKMATVSSVATYGIQCIKDCALLMKTTTLNTNGTKYNIHELRSAAVPDSCEVK